MPLQLLFAFDSEDYLTPEAADAERWWAEAMTRHGVTACICVVGELARVLRDRNRPDTVAAMARHEISYHSAYHSVHPTHAELLADMDWDAGVAAILAGEARGIETVSEVFGQRPVAFCKAGYSWGPPVVEAMRQMGVTALADCAFEWSDGRPMWYQNVLSLAYHVSFDEYFRLPQPERLQRMQADHERLADQYDGGTLVMYTHPCRLTTADFWDSVNFAAGRNPPRAEWQPAPLRPAAEIEALKQDIDAFIAWAIRRPGVQMTNYRSLLAEHRQCAGAWLDTEAALRSVAAVGDLPEPVSCGEEWLSPAEVFALAARALAGYAADDRLPALLPLRRPLGPTQAPAAAAGGAVPLQALLEAATWTDAAVSDTDQVPHHIPVGNSAIGPNAFLQAAREALAGLAAGERPAEVPLGTAEGVELANRPDLADLHFRGTWSVFPPDFEAPRLCEMARWQAWTGKPTRAYRSAK